MLSGAAMVFGFVTLLAISIRAWRAPRRETSKPAGPVQEFLRAISAKFWMAAHWGAGIALLLTTLRVMITGEIEQFELSFFELVTLVGIVSLSAIFSYTAIIFTISLIAWPIRRWRSRKARVDR